jgi:glutaredoxin 3
MDALKILMYSSPTCPHCISAKKYLDEKGVAYTDYDVIADKEKRKEMVDKSGQMGLPVLDVDGKIVVGFDIDAINQALGIQEN